ncbi:Pyruvate dehydrogenase acetyl-transferring kinase, mitochondrial [Hondaea fermentalgiana]|uniref:Protein-serine/threonine kinase n=1 Tax=Hondaea fermentalgiana TaxID=2315210 RepID=A0A2R5GSR4_9STRA|nr:Pyruvate dehydrogenase acetyl-transferring kinase, mitochondrial [Hondaea fermentalgiana]|eukprot:GBG31421.1 Pyruvate dehydrogenase acetyl-transferring kinase, mitochondrial [Hondaea fermentalgiana]
MSAGENDAGAPPPYVTYLRKMARLKATPVSLENLFRFGKASYGDKTQRLRNAQFLHNELQIRIAQRVVELEQLPLGLPYTTPIKSVIGWYQDYFDRVAESPFPQSEEDEEDFSDMLRFILQDHNEVIETTSRGVLEVRANLKGFSLDDQRVVDTVLNRFYLARIGLRFLIEHHITSRETQPGYAGIIQSRCKPVEILQDAALDAAMLCERIHGVAPRIECRQLHRKKMRKSVEMECNGDLDTDEDITFTYVPGHLRYMLGEVLKNAFRAVAEFEGPVDDEDHLSPIEVTIVEGPHDVAIRVSDRGGGIARPKLPLIWSYLHSTAKDPRIQDELLADGRTSPILAGYGVGLPLSRLYARYFGGDLDIKSLEGYGTDTYLHLSRLGDNCENLPPSVMRSPAEGDSSLPRGASNIFFFGDRRSWKENVLVGNADPYYEA